MLILVSYDVVDDRRRTRLAHSLKDFGRRVQYSVFECELDDRQIELLQSRVVGFIETEEDSVRIYKFCAACRARVEILGLGGPSEAPDVFILYAPESKKHAGSKSRFPREVGREC